MENKAKNLNLVEDFVNSKIQLHFPNLGVKERTTNSKVLSINFKT